MNTIDGEPDQCIVLSSITFVDFALLLIHNAIDVFRIQRLLLRVARTLSNFRLFLRLDKTSHHIEAVPVRL